MEKITSTSSYWGRPTAPPPTPPPNPPSSLKAIILQLIFMAQGEIMGILSNIEMYVFLLVKQNGPYFRPCQLEGKKKNISASWLAFFVSSPVPAVQSADASSGKQCSVIREDKSGINRERVVAGVTRFSGHWPPHFLFYFYFFWWGSSFLPSFTNPNPSPSIFPVYFPPVYYLYRSITAIINDSPTQAQEATYWLREQVRRLRMAQALPFLRPKSNLVSWASHRQSWGRGADVEAACQTRPGGTVKAVILIEFINTKLVGSRSRRCGE